MTGPVVGKRVLQCMLQEYSLVIFECLPFYFETAEVPPGDDLTFGLISTLSCLILLSRTFSAE